MNSPFIEKFEKVFEPDDHWYHEWVAKLDVSPTPEDVRFYAEQKVAELQKELLNPDPHWLRHAQYTQQRIDYYSGLTDIEKAPAIELSSMLYQKIDFVSYLYAEAHKEEFDCVGFTGGCTYTRKAKL